MLGKIRTFLIIFFLAIFLTTCNGGKMPEKTTHSPSIKDIPESAWKKLSEKKVYFGHQSVGNNIINGIKDLMKENPQVKLNILKTKDPTDFGAPIFAHANIGKNRNPKSKIDAFIIHSKRDWKQYRYSIFQILFCGCRCWNRYTKAFY
jgi:hypothetical protein